MYKNIKIGGRGRNRTYDVSSVPVLQTGAFASYAYSPMSL